MEVLEILLLSILIFQDFKERAISVWIFLSLFIIRVIAFLFLPANVHFLSILINVVYIAIIALCVFLYYFLRYQKQAAGTLKNSLGWGDIIIVFYFMLFLPSLFFIFFIQVSILLSLLLHFLFRRFSTRKEIPFAAYISMFYVLAVVSEWFTHKEIINDLLFLEWLKLF